MFTEKTCALLLCSLAFLIARTDAKSSKRLFLTWDNLTSCPTFQNKEIDMNRVQLYMTDPTTIRLKGDFDLKVDIEKGPLRITLEIEKLVSETSYMPIISYELKDICEKLGEENQPWSPYVLNLRPVPSKKCPLKQGTYNVDRITTDANDVELKREMVGKYRARIDAFRPDFTLGQGMPPRTIKICCYYLTFSVDSD